MKVLLRTKKMNKRCPCGRITLDNPGLCRRCGVFSDKDMTFPVPENALEMHTDEYILANIPLIKQIIRIRDYNQSKK